MGTGNLCCSLDWGTAEQGKQTRTPVESVLKTTTSRSSIYQRNNIKQTSKTSLKHDRPKNPRVLWTAAVFPLLLVESVRSECSIFVPKPRDEQLILLLLLISAAWIKNIYIPFSQPKATLASSPQWFLTIPMIKCSVLVFCMSSTWLQKRKQQCTHSEKM